MISLVIYICVARSFVRSAGITLSVSFDKGVLITHDMYFYY